MGAFCDFIVGYDDENHGLFASGVYVTEGPTFVCRVDIAAPDLLPSERRNRHMDLCQMVLEDIRAQVAAYNAATEPWPT